MVCFTEIHDCISGTEENYSELTQLLEDIFTYQRDVQTALSTKKEANKKDLDGKQMAQEM